MSDATTTEQKAVARHLSAEAVRLAQVARAAGLTDVQDRFLGARLEADRVAQRDAYVGRPRARR